jgi:hypothetical protein
MIATATHIAVTVSTIGPFVVVVIGGALYGLGVIRPVKTDARWRATTHEKLGEVVVVDATLQSRTRNTQTVHEAGLVKDPGWPRWLRTKLHDRDLTPFQSSAAPMDIAGHGTADLNGVLPGTALPYDRTRLWVRAGTRGIYFKLKPDQLVSGQPLGPSHTGLGG